MKKIFGLIGTLAGAGLAGLGVYSLVKGKKDPETVKGYDDCESEDYEDDEDDSNEE